MTSTRRIPRLLALAVGASALAAVCLTAPAPSEARGGGATNPPPAPVAGNPNQALGGQLFDQCVRWVSRGGAGVTRTTDFFIGLTAELDLDTTRHRGPMRLWWKAPDKFRQALTTGGQTTTKILNSDFMWIIHPNNSVQRMHGTPEGANAVRQLKDDRERMADLAQFITLRSLQGPGVTFDFNGEKAGSGSYAGQWVKITRRAPGATLMHFWLAYQKDDRGAYMATYPGIIRVEGDAQKGIPTEDFILKSWVDSQAGNGPAFRYPRELEAYSISPGKPSLRFLKATVNSIRINGGIPDTEFKPPARR
jgi:outer membrane lipoprotein-sorting protein